MQFGKLQSARQEGQEVRFVFEHGTGSVSVLNPFVFNVFSGLESEDRHSIAIEENPTEKTALTVTQADGCVTIATEAVVCKVYDNFYVDFLNADGTPVCCDWRGERQVLPVASPKMKELMAQEGHFPDDPNDRRTIEILKAVSPDDHFYGLGDKVGFMDRRGYGYETWNTDDPKPHTELYRALYKSIPFFLVRGARSVYGIFMDNHYHGYFDFARESQDYYWFGASGGNLDYYYIAGQSMPEIVTRYTALTGRTPLPQLWTLGHHQSRWSYMDENEVRGIAENYRKFHIPCDTIHLDIDYMDHYKVFTFSPDAFSEIGKLTANLRRDGFKIVSIIDPGVKAEKGYRIYDEGVQNGYFCKTPEGEVYENAVWPGLSAFPDFGRADVRVWWADNQKYLLEQGIRGTWNDMNEPASFNGPLPDDVVMTDEDRPSTHAAMHNVYGHNMDKATYEGLKKHDGRRPFVITRAAYAGTQKYSTVWTGDNTSLWAHLQTVIPQLTTLGLCGFGFGGTDLGGFGGDTTPELLVRWAQVAAFSPLMRNHSCMGSRYQEPWKFGEKTLSHYRKAVKLHYQLIPVFYDLFREGEKTGLAPLRPLVLHYETDARAQQIFDEALLGENILVSPVVTQGAVEKLVYLPAGEWYDFWTGERHVGPCSFVRSAPLDTVPMFVKSGTILPGWEEMEFIPDAPQKSLILTVFPGDGSYTHYQDNGADFAYRDGEYNQYEIAKTGEKLTVKLVKHGFAPTYETITVRCGGKAQTKPFAPELEFTL